MGRLVFGSVVQLLGWTVGRLVGRWQFDWTVDRSFGRMVGSFNLFVFRYGFRSVLG
jgi:hypothetical protein